MDDITLTEMLFPPKGKVKVVLDTDTFNEIDDQFALTHLLLSTDKCDVQAIYAAPFSNQIVETPGEGMELSYEEINRLLEKLSVQKDNFVLKGVTQYVGESKQSQESPAVDDLIARARESSSHEPLYVIAIAAISNVASALLKAPDIRDKIVVVWLGGHALEWINADEFNAKQDVGGAQVLFDSGAPVVLVPCLGVASHLHSTVPEIEAHVEPNGDIGAFLAKRFKGYSDDHLGWSKVIWDMAAVAFVLEPDWTLSYLTPSPILNNNLTWSRDPRRHNIRYVYKLNRTAIMKDFFIKLREHAK